jgi:hypothetical protein
MTDSERQQILKMIEDGKITPEQGLKLMQALEETPVDEEEPSALPGGEPEGASVQIPEPIGEADEEKAKREAFFAKKINRFRRLWAIPLIFGILVTIGAAYWMYSSLESAGMNFWFFCAWVPFFLGILVTALAFSSRESRWLYVNVKQKPGEKPGRIVISFPIGLVTWLVNIFGGVIPTSDRAKANMVMGALQKGVTSDEPILVEVDDEDGEHVQVYIG